MIEMKEHILLVGILLVEHILLVGLKPPIINGVNDYLKWIFHLDAMCEKVRISSTNFRTEHDDYVIINNDIRLSGRYDMSNKLDIVVDGLFLIEFVKANIISDLNPNRDSGFDIDWSCELHSKFLAYNIGTIFNTKKFRDKSHFQ